MSALPTVVVYGQASIMFAIAFMLVVIAIKIFNAWI